MVRSVVLAAVTVAVTLAVAQGRPRVGAVYSPFFGTIPCTYEVDESPGDAAHGSAVDPNSVTAVHLRVPASPILAPVVLPPTFRPGIFAPSPFLAIRHDAQVPTMTFATAPATAPQQETPTTGPQSVVGSHQIIFPNAMFLSSIPVSAPEGDDDEDDMVVRMPQQVFMFMPANIPPMVFSERHDAQAPPFGLRRPVQEVPAIMRDPSAPAPAVATPVDPVETIFGVPPTIDTLYSAPPRDASSAGDSGAVPGMSLPQLDHKGRPLVQLPTFPTEIPNPFFDASALQRGEGEEGTQGATDEGGPFHGVVPAGIAQALQPTFETVAFENSKAHPSLLGKRPAEDGDAVVIA